MRNVWDVSVRRNVQRTSFVTQHRYSADVDKRLATVECVDDPLAMVSEWTTYTNMGMYKLNRKDSDQISQDLHVRHIRVDFFPLIVIIYHIKPVCRFD